MNEVNGRMTAAVEMGQEIPLTREELEAMEVFLSRESAADNCLLDIPWDDTTLIDCPMQSYGSSIEHETNVGSADLVVADDDGELPYPEYWELGPTSTSAPESHALALHENGAVESGSGEGETKLVNFTNLPDLDFALGMIEAQHVETPVGGRAGVWKARAEVINAIQQAFQSRFNLGKALSAYRDLFKAERGWIEASNAIAEALHICEKTVRNKITDYEQLSAALPEEVIQAAELRGIDLAQKKFLSAVKSVEGTISPNHVVSEEQASQIVDNIIACKTADKTAKSPKPVPSIEEFADRTATSFEKLLRGASPEVRYAEVRFVLESVNHKLGTSIRDLRQYTRPTMVPRPSTSTQEAAGASTTLESHGQTNNQALAFLFAKAAQQISRGV